MARITLPSSGGSSGGGGGAVDPGGIDDPTTWTPSLGYDQEFETASTTPPPGWRWENQGDVSYVESQYGAVLSMPTQPSNTVRALVRSIPPEPSWEMTAKIAVSPLSGSYWGAALIILDASSGKNVQWGPSFNAGWRFNVANWSGLATGSSATHVVLQTDDLAPLSRYWRVRKNSSTSWDFEASLDGLAWRTVDAGRNITTHAASPTDIGLSIWASGQPARAAVEWVRVR